MKKLLSITLAILMCISMSVTVFADMAFTDVTTDDWFYDDVKTAYEMGLINGKTSTTYAPYDNVTYAEVIKLAACMNQLYVDGAVTLTGGDPWYMPYVEYCKKNGIITKEYSFDEYATRAGYMEIFANALPDSAFKVINDIPNGSIADVKKDAAYADSVYKLYRAGIVTGVDEKHNCNPDANIIRAEVATIIARMMNEEKRVEFEMPEFNELVVNIGTVDDTDISNMTPAIEINTKPDDEPVIVVPPISYEDVEKVPTQVVTPGAEIIVVPSKPVDVESGDLLIQDTPLTIHKQPEGSDSEAYGTKYELEVQVFGGKAPYSYQWMYYTGYRNETETIENGDYAKDVTKETLVISVEEENVLLGQKIYCVITDAMGTTVKTNPVKIFGPFSMTAEDVTIVEATKEYSIVGTLTDGLLKKGDGISITRNDKIIAIGSVKDIQMFNKSLDEAEKGDRVAVIFTMTSGVRPQSGDVLLRWQDYHVVDTSDIVN